MAVSDLLKATCKIACLVVPLLSSGTLSGSELFNLDFTGGETGVYDSVEVRSLNFHGGLDSIYAFQSSPFVSQILATFSNDTLYHIGVSLDLGADVWSVALDGTPVFTNPLNGASLTGIRFGMAPWITGAVDAPDTYAALDNVVLSVIPGPSSVTLAMAGLLLWLGRVRTRFRT